MIGFSDLKSVVTGVILALVVTSAAGAAGYAAWKARGAMAAEEIAQVNKEWEKKLTEQEQLTDHYSQLATEQFGLLRQEIGQIEIKHVTITKNITVERESNPEFYNQALPDGGREEWLKARSLVQ